MIRQEEFESLQSRTERLESRLRLFQCLLALSLGGGALYACATAPRARSPRSGTPEVLRARGLVIEDEEGRDRILLGAPIPSGTDRLRPDPATALVFLGEDGIDRMAVGFVPNPQVDGEVRPRIAAQVGIQINDPRGAERTGYGYLENGRVNLGLDYAVGREAVMLTVDDVAGHAAILVHGENGGRERAGIYVGRHGPSLMKVSDTAGEERVMLLVEGDAPARMILRDPATNSMTDALQDPAP